MTDDSKTPPPVRARRSPAGGLALLLSLIALIGLAYLWYLLRYHDHVLGVNVPKRLAAIERAHADIDHRLAGIDVQQTLTDQRVKRLRRAVRALGMAGAHQRRFGIREARDLLLMANERLRFDHDVPLALDALRQADHVLARERDPRLLPVRQAIADEIVRLHGLSRQHIRSTALRLLALARAVDKLPLGIPAHFMAVPVTVKPAAASPNFWVRAWDGLRRDMLRLIQIRKQPANEPMLLAPQHAYFLRQNLKLQLYAAEVALLEHHPAVTGANLAVADHWVRQYFATGQPPVAAFLRELATLRARASAIQWPPLTRSLALLQQITGRP